MQTTSMLAVSGAFLAIISTAAAEEPQPQVPPPGKPAIGLVAPTAFPPPPGPDEPIIGTIRVVDPGNPRADDTGPGDEARPWKSLGQAMKSAKAGETVCVMAGTYEGGKEKATSANAGTAERPIVFRSIPRFAAKLEKFPWGQKQAFIRIEGFHFSGGGITAEADGLQVVGNRFTGVGCGVYIHAKSGIKNTYIGYNEVADSQYGFLVAGEGCLVESNEVRRLLALGKGDCDYSRFFGKSHVFRFNLYHGTKKAETADAHVDCFQTFGVGGLIAQDVTFEHNRLMDFHQSLMTSSPTLGQVSGLTYRYNVASVGLADFGAKSAWGTLLWGVKDCVVEHNTFSGITWFGIGLNKGSVNCRAMDNIVLDSATPWQKEAATTDCAIQRNLAFPQKSGGGDESNLFTDPKCLDAAKGNFRLAKDSPAVGAGTNGTTMGALPYPYVYYVDPRHPGANDVGLGYAGQPFKTLAKACAMARKGETILLRGGIYRETLKPLQDGVSIRALEGESVTLSGADVVEGWQFQTSTWVASCEVKPVRMLRDGQEWKGYTYDVAGKKLTLQAGDDPRLHRFEAVVRERAIDLGGRANITIGDLKTANTLADPVVSGTGNRITVMPAKTRNAGTRP